MARHQMRKGLAKSKRPSLSASTSSSSRALVSKQPTATKAGPSTSFEGFDNLPRSAKLTEIDRQVKMAKTSTASLGKYDNKLKGEPAKERGEKRKFESNEMHATTEKERYLSVLRSLDNDEKVQRRREGVSETSTIMNARKAIRSASKGRGSASLAGEEKKSRFSKQGSANRESKGRGTASKTSATKKSTPGKRGSSLTNGKRK